MQLGPWLQKEAMNQDSFGQKLDPPVPQGSISHWVNGRHLPPLPYFAQIQTITSNEVSAADFIAAHEAFKARLTESAVEAG